MISKPIKERFVFAIAIGVSVFLLFLVVACALIGYEIDNRCHEAQSEYGGDCVESLVSLLKDEDKDFRSRNEAVWALGQLGDARALPALKSYDTGHIPSREPLDQTLSQYELKKAINLAGGGFNMVGWTWKDFLNTNRYLKRELTHGTIVVAQQSDPYYSLAQKIAREENLQLIDEFADGLQLNPTYVILVASPKTLTAERLSGIGKIFKNRDYYPALGIITGSTLDAAEQLWERRSFVKEGNSFVGGDVDILQSIYEPTIFDITAGADKKIALNKEGLVEALKQADYFYWTRHTGPKDWSWNEEYGNWTENDQLLAKDIPRLKPAVIYSLTCRPFRPWEENSLSLGFIDKGAAVYLGFVNTPHSTAFMRHSLYVPGITSWHDFPLGVVAQIHNKTAAKFVFSSPQLFMLGDPRIFISKEQPYRITSDTARENGKRTIEGASDVKGILSLKIANGAEYDFISVNGLTSTSENDLFYNSKLQTLNLGADKYVLFLHHGGQFEIELLKHAPPGWIITDTLTDAFDFSWVVLWLSTYADSNPHIYFVSIVIFAGILLFKFFWQKKSLREYRMIFAAASILVLIRLAYFLWRCDDYTVSANLVSYAPLQIALGCLGVFSATAGGLFIMKDSRRRALKLLGLLFAVARQFWLAGFYLVFITLLNSFTPITKNTEPWLLSYDTFWLSSIVLIFEIAVILALYRYLIFDRKQ